MAGEDRISRVPLPSDVDALEKKRLQPWVDPYTYWVVNKLVGVRGKDDEDVTYYILRDWIKEHQADLDRLGISVKVRGGHLIVGHSKEA